MISRFKIEYFLLNLYTKFAKFMPEQNFLYWLQGA